MPMTNETWEIEIKSPLIRPGITLRTHVTGKYLFAVIEAALDKLREFNKKQPVEASLVK